LIHFYKRKGHIWRLSTDCESIEGCQWNNLLN